MSDDNFSLFIDIDGTITIPSHDQPFHTPQLKEGIEEFIIWAVANFDCYWLSAWGVNGDMSFIKTHLLPRLPLEATLIGIAKWNRLKTEALPTDLNFIFIDDDLLPAEMGYLDNIGALDNYIKADPREPSMKPIMQKIKSARRKIENK